MKVRIQDTDLELKFTVGTTHEYETKYQRPFDITQLGMHSVLMDYFYCNVYMMMKEQKKQLEMTEEEFFQWIDENGGYGLLNEYGYWLAKQIQIQLKLTPQEEIEEETEEDPFKKKPKKTKKQN